MSKEHTYVQGCLRSRSKGVSLEKTPQLPDSLEVVSCDRDYFLAKECRSKGVSLEKTPQLPDSLEIVSGEGVWSRGTFFFRGRCSGSYTLYGCRPAETPH